MGNRQLNLEMGVEKIPKLRNQMQTRECDGGSSPEAALQARGGALRRGFRFVCLADATKRASQNVVPPGGG
jgi:hypothetical protein